MPLFKTHCLIFIVLAIVTLYLHDRFEQYEWVGSDLLTGEWDIRATEGSRIEVTDHGLILYALNAHKIVSAQQAVPLPRPGTILKLSAQLRSVDVLPGQKPWHTARLILVQNSGDKDHWNLPHTAAALYGSQDWSYFQKTFLIAAATQKIRVAAQLNQASGLFQLDNIRLHPVRESTVYPIIKNTILTTWGAFFLLLAGSCAARRGASVLARTILILIIISIILGTLIPGDIKQHIAFEFTTQVNIQGEQFIAGIPWDLSEVWHFVFFLLLGVMLGWIMIGESFFRMMIIALLIAGGTEFAQLYVEGRSTSVADFLLDALGSILGFSVVRAIRYGSSFLSFR
ncbi:MAG: VanZ family protein [Nitrosomonas sp.]|nr:MAG: VanZ family protein [Nitrosomonas sp.]